MVTDARVVLWGRDIGAVSWIAERDVAVFQYVPEFVRSGIQVAPMTMPLREAPFEFPSLARETFRGLPGLLADSLPDRFGHALIDAWLAAQGRDAASFNSVERLCYVGRRGMGALEFEPAVLGPPTEARRVEVESLVTLANRVLEDRAGLHGRLGGVDDAAAMEDILRVGTSAGGARAKAVLAFNPGTGEFRSGQVEAGAGFEPWILKLDGVASGMETGLGDPAGYGLVELAYHRMAVAAGLEMTECRLHHEGGRSHFMTRRFDRTPTGGKRHMQSLGALAHLDYNQPASASYEQALNVMRRLGLPRRDLEQQVTRAIYNVVARNQDDHVKNIAFLMDRRGDWRLSPAFDVSYAFDPRGTWTSRHQMSLNGKRDGFERADLVALARHAGVKAARASDILDRVLAAVRRWPDLAAETGVDEARIASIARAHRLEL